MQWTFELSLVPNSRYPLGKALRGDVRRRAIPGQLAPVPHDPLLLLAVPALAAQVVRRAADSRGGRRGSAGRPVRPGARTNSSAGGRPRARRRERSRPTCCLAPLGRLIGHSRRPAAWHERAGCLVGSSARPGRQRSSSVAHKPDRTEFGEVGAARSLTHVRCGTADPARTCVLEAGTRRQQRGAHGWDRTGGDRRSSSDLSLDGTTSWWRWLRAVERGTRRCRRAAVPDGHFLKWPQGVGSVAAVVRQPEPQKHAPPAETQLAAPAECASLLWFVFRVRAKI